MKGSRLSASVVSGWVLSLGGTALWLYGYFVVGHPPLIDWQTYTPWWVADYLHNMESEFGLILMVGGSAVIYWPV